MSLLASSTSGWTVIADVAVVVAAVASSLGLWFARQTVGVARETLRDARKFHGDEEKARQRDLDLAEQELDARRSQFESELALQRAMQIQRVLEIAIDLRQHAADVDDRNMQVQHRIPPLGAKLAAGLLGLEALGVEVPQDFYRAADGAEHETLPLVQIRGALNAAIKALMETLKGMPVVAPDRESGIPSVGH